MRDYRRRTPVHPDSAVEEPAAGVRQAIAAGASLEGELQKFSQGHHAVLRDRFGRGFGVLRFNARGDDAAA